ncbi:MAG: SprT family zinc-dependent metalloprotease [Propionibacteriaceae bacterium]|nr:SprT family zinc-dependent metalloprotease [Propionibacteriaceae bacterium]
MSDVYQMQVGDVTATVTRKRMKNIRLKVIPPGEVVVSAPYGLTDDAIQDFIASKRDWITRHRKQASIVSAHSDQLADGGAAWFWGTRYELQWCCDRGSKGAWLEASRLLVRCPESSQIPQLVAQFRHAEMVRLVPPLVGIWVPRLGVPNPERIRFRAMKSRWGSCRADTRSLSFNTELSRFPAEALEYVVVHELTHLQFPHHGPRFWSVVEAALPDHQMRRALLRKAH